MGSIFNPFPLYLLLPLPHLLLFCLQEKDVLKSDTTVTVFAPLFTGCVILDKWLSSLIFKFFK
jgi:hypothetical protein